MKTVIISVGIISAIIIATGQLALAANTTSDATLDKNFNACYTTVM